MSVPVHPLVELQQRAIELQNRKRFREAIELFEMIVKERPDWEHGSIQHSLSYCYEELHEYEKAEQWLLAALQYDPDNPYFISSYASFLYLHGDPRKSFDMHMRMLELEGADSTFSPSIEFLKNLGAKVGLSDEAVNSKRDEALERYRNEKPVRLMRSPWKTQ